MLFDSAGVVPIAGSERLGQPDQAAQDLNSLIGRARAGDASAFEQLMIVHQRQVLCTATRILRCREDAKDAAQEVFFRLYRNLARINPAAVRSWLYRVTINVCHDMDAKTKRFTISLGDKTEAHEIPVAATAESAVAQEEQRGILSRALQALPFKERAALVLRDIEGLSTEETAHILGSSAVTVRSQISCARVKVRQFCERVMGK